jgi:D-sedoheptulose 7-phosphate isomerase
MDENLFINDYWNLYQKALSVDVSSELIDFKNLCLQVKSNHNKLMFAGNGASASIASHAALDFTKQAKVQSMAFNDHSLITAYSNDYGYQNWVAKCIDSYARSGDVVVLISSSGNSSNIVKAAKRAKELNLSVVTFSGFDSGNKLKQFGDINFWLDSKAYNIIESIHGIWIFAVVDMLVGKAVYNVSI